MKPDKPEVGDIWMAASTEEAALIITKIKGKLFDCYFKHEPDKIIANIDYDWFLTLGYKFDAMSRKEKRVRTLLKRIDEL